jgi:hypothetical protein
MRSDRISYITALSAPGELGSTPPTDSARLLEHLAPLPTARELVAALFLFDDLLQREAFLAGELQVVQPTVLTVAQVRNEAPLPAYLAVPTESGSLVSRVDGLWEAAYRHADRVARKYGSVFLREWVAYEVALRNALAGARAKRLGLEEAHYLVAADLADQRVEFTSVLGEWTAAKTPLAGLQVLIRARWAWLDEHDAWFSFRDDELAAYAARLMLLQQWKRVADDEERRSAGTPTDESSNSLERATR